MISSNLSRLAGWCGVIAAVCLAAGALAHPAESVAAYRSAQWAIAHNLLLVSLLFGIPAVAAYYLVIADRAGTIGLVGYLGTFVGMALFIGITYYEAYINPVLAEMAPDFVAAQAAGELPGALNLVLPFTGLVYSAGWLLFGIALLRDGRLSRVAAAAVLAGGVLLGLGAVLPLVVFYVAAVVQSLGLAILGFALARGVAPSESTRARLAT